MKRNWIVLLVVLVLALATAGAVAASSTNGGGSKTIYVKESSLIDHECNSSEWHFVITRIGSVDQAPPYIWVNWHVPGSPIYVMGQVKRDSFVGGVANYRTSDHLDLEVTNGIAVIYDSWDEEFILSSGPCAAQPTQTSTSTLTPTATPNVHVNAGVQCFTSNPLARQAIVNVSVQNRSAYVISAVGTVEETGSSITFDTVGPGETWGFAIYTGVLVLNGGNVRFDISVAGQFSESVLASYSAIDCQPSTPTPTWTPTPENTPTPVLIGTASVECYGGRATLHTGAWNRSQLTVRVVVALEGTTWVQLGWLAPGQYGTLDIGMYPNVEAGKVYFQALDSGNQAIGTASASYPATDCRLSTVTPTSMSTSTATPIVVPFTRTATSTPTRTNTVPPTRTPVRGTPTNTPTPTPVPVCQFNEESAVSSGQYTSIGQYALNLLEPAMMDGIPNDGAWTAVFTFTSPVSTPIAGVMGGWLFNCAANTVGNQCAFAERDRWTTDPVWITKTVMILPGASSFNVDLVLPNGNSFVQLDWKTLILDSGQILPASRDWKVGVHIKKSPGPVGCRMP